MTTLYRFGLRYFRWLMYFLFFLRVENRECIPREGNYIVLSNHVSAWDPLTVVVAGKFHVRPMAKKELYKIKPLGFLLRKLGCIQVDRTDGARALALARKSLERKEVMLIFPEGTRSKTGALLDFKAGAFALSIKTATPILPCQIIAPRGMRLFCGIKVRFGPVISPEEVNFGDEDRTYERAISFMKAVFYEMRGEEMPKSGNESYG